MDSGVQNSGSSIYTNFGVRVDHELYRNFILSGFGNVSTYEYDDIDRDDDVTEFGAMGTYKVNKKVHLSAYARHVNRDRSGASVFGDQDYSADLLGISVRVFP